jgi:hypothetical protein
LNVSIEIELSVYVRCGDHLGKVNESYLVLIVQDYIELIEVAVNETVVAQVNNQIHDVVEHLLMIGQFVYLTQWVAGHQAHDNFSFMEKKRIER